MSRRLAFTTSVTLNLKAFSRLAIAFASFAGFFSAGTFWYAPLPSTNATLGAFRSLTVPADCAHTHAYGAGRNRAPAARPALRADRRLQWMDRMASSR